MKTRVRRTELAYQWLSIYESSMYLFRTDAYMSAGYYDGIHKKHLVEFYDTWFLTSSTSFEGHLLQRWNPARDSFVMAPRPLVKGYVHKEKKSVYTNVGETKFCT